MTLDATVAARSGAQSSAISKYAGWLASALCIVSLFGAGQLGRNSQGCSTVSQAKSIAQEISTELQRQASAKAIAVEALAAAIRDLNTESLKFEASQNATEYCQGLQNLRERLVLKAN